MLGVNEADAHMLKQVELTHYYFLKWDDVTLAIEDINSLLVDNLVRFVDFRKKDANTVFLSFPFVLYISFLGKLAIPKVHFFYIHEDIVKSHSQCIERNQCTQVNFHSWAKPVSYLELFGRNQ